MKLFILKANVIFLKPKCPPGGTQILGDVLICAGLLVNKIWLSEDSIIIETATLIFCSCFSSGTVWTWSCSDNSLIGHSIECCKKIFK